MWGGDFRGIDLVILGGRCQPHQKGIVSGPFTVGRAFVRSLLLWGGRFSFSHKGEGELQGGNTRADTDKKSGAKFGVSGFTSDTITIGRRVGGT